MSKPNKKWPVCCSNEKLTMVFGNFVDFLAWRQTLDKQIISFQFPNWKKKIELKHSNVQKGLKFTSSTKHIHFLQELLFQNVFYTLIHKSIKLAPITLSFCFRGIPLNESILYILRKWEILSVIWKTTLFY